MIKARIFLLLLTAALVSCGIDSSFRPNTVAEVLLVEFSDTRVFADHMETDIRLPTSDTTLGGTLFLPLGRGVFPAVVLQPGSQPWERTNTADYLGSGAAYYNSLGVAAWSYDKRGLGKSGGICCQGNILQLADDALASIKAISVHPRVDATRIGIDGVSQGGWVAVNAAARSTSVAFVISKVGPAVSTFEEQEYSRLTGDSVCVASGRSELEIDNLMAHVKPAGYDPRPDLAAMSQPAIWFYGGLDTSIPVRQSISVLKELRTADSKNWVIILQPYANHFMIENGGPCQSVGNKVSNVQDFERWFNRVVVLGSH